MKNEIPARGGNRPAGDFVTAELMPDIKWLFDGIGYRMSADTGMMIRSDSSQFSAKTDFSPGYDLTLGGMVFVDTDGSGVAYGRWISEIDNGKNRIGFGTYDGCALPEPVKEGELYASVNISPRHAVQNPPTLIDSPECNYIRLTRAGFESGGQSGSRLGSQKADFRINGKPFAYSSFSVTFSQIAEGSVSFYHDWEKDESIGDCVTVDLSWIAGDPASGVGFHAPHCFLYNIRKTEHNGLLAIDANFISSEGDTLPAWTLSFAGRK